MQELITLLKRDPIILKEELKASQIYAKIMILSDNSRKSLVERGTDGRGKYVIAP